MSRTRATIDDAVVVAGWDHAVGFFVEVRRRGQPPRVYDALEPNYDFKRPLLGALEFLVATDIVGQGDLQLILAAEADGERIPEQLRTVGELLTDLRASGDC